VVTGRGCADWRGELAARALGVASAEDDIALDAHLDGCRACRSELDELRASADALALADPDRLDPPDSGPFLADQIVERVAAESAAGRRRRRRRLAAVAGALAVAAAVVVAVALGTGPRAEDTPALELAGSDGVTGSAMLTDRPWGTEITLEVEGLDEGHTYWLWLTDDDGDRVVAGSLTGTGDRAHAVLASALASEDARRIWMTDEADRVVLDARLPSP
jgi:predicted anti-sigma-YlaC factor YlaD